MSVKPKHERTLSAGVEKMLREANISDKKQVVDRLAAANQEG